MSRSEKGSGTQPEDRKVKRKREQANDAVEAKSGPSEDKKSKEHKKRRTSQSASADTSVSSSKKHKEGKQKSKKGKGKADDDQEASRGDMESSPPPYQPPEASNEDDKEDPTPEQRAAIEASLRPEALANERSAQMNLLSSLMDPTGQIAIKAKVKAQQQDEQGPSSIAEMAPAQHQSSAPPQGTQDKPAKTKARLFLEQRQAENAAKARENGSSWQPAQRYVPPSAQQEHHPSLSSSADDEDEASVSQQPQSTPAKKDSSEGKSKSSKSEKPVKMASLKDMFKPQEADAGFSLADVLDEAELEEDDYDPFAAFKPAEPSDVAPLASAYPSRPSHAAPIRSGPLPKASEAPLFFPLCLDDESDKVVQSLNLTEDQKARLEDRSWTSGAGRRFVQLGSVEDIAKHHEEMRPKLTEQVRKRHREAVRKVQRRKGGGA